MPEQGVYSHLSRKLKAARQTYKKLVSRIARLPINVQINHHNKTLESKEFWFNEQTSGLAIDKQLKSFKLLYSILILKTQLESKQIGKKVGMQIQHPAKARIIFPNGSHSLLEIKYK